VLRRREGICLSSPSDDEVGGSPARSARSDVRAADLQEKPTKRLKKRGDSPAQAFRRIGRRRRLPGEHRSERSEPLDIAGASERSNQTGSRAAFWTNERAASLRHRHQFAVMLAASERGRQRLSKRDPRGASASERSNQTGASASERSNQNGRSRGSQARTARRYRSYSSP
jgi:hypothetical protein